MRALLSVYDKTGLEAFARGLVSLGYELISSGGTSRSLAAADIPHVEVETVTGAPEMLGGRVKTLHPHIHGGILADRSKPDHMAALAEQGIEAIDLVACNLYPFRAEPSIEMIDVGGPTMVRAAAKNHHSVAVLVDPADYQPVLDELRREGGLSDETRRRLARAAFAHTAAYDAAIVTWFDSSAAEEPLPPTVHLALERAQDLRYGENPHQVGARYRIVGERGWWDEAVQHGGKELSYLNLYDTEAAWQLVHDLGDQPAVAVIKHANPCGVAVADDVTTAYTLAHECDPRSAFGGIVAINRPVPLSLAEALAPVFTEVVIAPSYDEDALALLLSKKNMRVLTAPAPTAAALDFRQI
ncbi:MAG: bifunctional phosphoribosylaminoimidazolecarboxamide formyltransferase/IMP cyclohydrolase, partial [Actinobacteria bacterium]|nr:bifunctional phosphoribosylaminoimidazolecarboxamide formyltransferase/IMP cyclohydrolase [Actinomycetota bacterium]